VIGHDGTTEDPDADIPGDNYFNADASSFPVPPRSFDASSNTFISGRPVGIGTYRISGPGRQAIDPFNKSPLAEKGDIPKMRT
jgi:hypothetical protein